MTIDRPRGDGSRDQEKPEALLVFLGVFVIGMLLMAAVNLVFPLGPAVGNVVFVALPVVAATAAAASSRSRD